MKTTLREIEAEYSPENPIPKMTDVSVFLAERKAKLDNDIAQIVSKAGHKNLMNRFEKDFNDMVEQQRNEQRELKREITNFGKMFSQFQLGGPELTAKMMSDFFMQYRRLDDIKDRVRFFTCKYDSKCKFHGNLEADQIKDANQYNSEA